ncbi:hypothetical protein G7Z17_g4542 [Cylindrodendrum hubeiense]|uniref:Bacteriophage T5 Orf172 DNA-binding domain-containing protein n=1 Tax=Cylindrodendrum hubeiense TaxID=595255 RepID=A0A9P5HEQ4_9HYPO|nr:hypothetical protein G7Z17_g4542 [Cylindrodendrum hubeiense]
MASLRETHNEPERPEIVFQGVQIIATDSIPVGDSTTQASGSSPSTIVDGSETSQSQNTATTLDLSELEEDYNSSSVTPGPECNVTETQKGHNMAMTTPEPVPVEERNANRSRLTDETFPKAPIPDSIEPSDKEIDDMVAELESEEKDPVTLERCKSRLTINRSKSRLVHYIHRPFDQNDLKKGVVYVLKHLQNGEIMKVGFTEKHIGNNGLPSCYANDCEVVYQSKQRFPGAFRVEKLVNAALKRNRHRTDCSHCSMSHEWLQVTEVDMIEAVETWTAFVTSSAYSDGKLSEAGHLMTDVLVDLSSKRVAGVLNEFSSVTEKNEPARDDLQTKDSSTISNTSQNTQFVRLPIRRKEVSRGAIDNRDLAAIGEDQPPPQDSNKAELDSQNSQPATETAANVTGPKRSSLGDIVRETKGKLVEGAKAARTAVKTAAGRTLTYFQRPRTNEDLANDVTALRQERGLFFDLVSRQFNSKDMDDKTEPSKSRPSDTEAK